MLWCGSWRKVLRVSALYCAPGNAGMCQQAQAVPLAADDLVALRDFAAAERIDLTVVGPELPLALGISDVFARAWSDGVWSLPSRSAA